MDLLYYGGRLKPQFIHDKSLKNIRVHNKLNHFNRCLF